MNSRKLAGKTRFLCPTVALTLGLTACAPPLLVNGSGSSCTYTMTTDANGKVTVSCDAGGGDGGDGGGSSSMISFSPSSLSVTEGGIATLTLVRSGELGWTNSITIARTGGTAASGADYAAFPAQTITFSANETMKSVQLATLDDGVPEPDETVVFTLSGPTGGAALGVANATVSISDNDAGGGGGNCGARPQGTTEGQTNIFSSPGVASDTPTIQPGSAYAYPFAIDPQIFPNGARLNMAANTSVGGQNGKEVVVSACPGDFTPLNSYCRRVLSGGVTTIYLKESAFCTVRPGQTYYINVRPYGNAPASVKMSTTML